MITRLTRKKAIQICKELWTWLAETGKNKSEWPEWEKYGTMHIDCPFCKYARESVTGDCNACPYNQKFGYCDLWDTPYCKWRQAESADERKEAAKAFLAQLEQLE